VTRLVCRRKPATHDWCKPQSLPVVIPEVMALQTLADVQPLMRHLPEDRRERSTWRDVAAKLEDAALKGDTNDVGIALRMVLIARGDRMAPDVRPRRFSPPWSVDETQAC
jgi:hypothetical protein